MSTPLTMARPAALALVAGLAVAACPRAGAQTVRTVEFEAPSVGLTTRYNVALPRDYEASGRRYPVLYLLHGYTSHYLDWARLGAPAQAKDLDLILVMPDAGNTWYVNWAAAEGDRPNNWEDFIVRDLIADVDARFRTVARREGRAINGLSMGGFGAIMLGLRHPDLFCSIGSQSGALTIARTAANLARAGITPPRPDYAKDPNPEIGIEGFSSQDERSPRGRAFTKPEDCEAHDPFLLVDKVPAGSLPHIYLDCGVDDRLYAGNAEFARRLLEKKVPFTFAQSTGGHLPAYWIREVGHAIAVQYEILERGLAELDPKALAGGR